LALRCSHANDSSSGTIRAPGGMLRDARESAPEPGGDPDRELADNAGWEMLAAIAEKAGKGQLADSFQSAHSTEVGHLTKVQQWLRNGHGMEG
jgi:hypothetical protein